MTTAKNWVAHLIRSSKDQGGYTLVEMVSVLAIIAVLSALVIANTSFGDARQQLRDSVAGYVTAVKQAETLASSSRTVADSAGVIAPRSAYGVCLTSSAAAVAGVLKCNAPTSGQAVDTYQIYARAKTDTTYTNRPNQPDIIATYRVPKKVIFQPGAVSIWVDYLPPGPVMLVNGSTAGAEVLVTAAITGQDTYTRSAGLRANAGAAYVK